MEKHKIKQNQLDNARKYFVKMLDKVESLVLFVYFVRSGYIGLGLGFLRSAVATSDYYSCSGMTSKEAYYLDFNTSEMRPSGGPATRSYGFSLRCLQE